MVHVNVRPNGHGTSYVLEVSNDGAPFIEHWTVAARGENLTEARIAAKSDGRIYAAGIKYGGAEVQMTAFGESVHVPDMATISCNPAQNNLRG